MLESWHVRKLDLTYILTYGILFLEVKEDDYNNAKSKKPINNTY